MLILIQNINTFIIRLYVINYSLKPKIQKNGGKHSLLFYTLSNLIEKPLLKLLCLDTSLHGYTVMYFLSKFTLFILVFFFIVYKHAF